LSSTTGSTGDSLYYNVDLRAMDARTSSKVLDSDYYQASDKTHPATGAPGTLIQSAFVQDAYGYGDPFNGGPNTPANVFVTTNSTGDVNLTHYLNTQAAALPDGFVFLRLTPDSYPNVGTSGVEFSSADNSKISQRPVIQYTLTAAAVPEASTQVSLAVLLAFGLIGWTLKTRKQA
jgi:hypothetical protein